jgi:hypothetical protein
MPEDVDVWLGHFYAAWYPFSQASRRFVRKWTKLVRSLEVTLYPGGRAEIRHPEESAIASESAALVAKAEETGVVSPDFLAELQQTGPRYTVTLRWEVRDGRTAITEVRIDTRDRAVSGLWGAFDLAAYVAALYLAIDAREERSAKETPPRPGRPADTGFYRNVLAEYEQLLREGHPSPIQEIARRRKVPKGTVKSWRSRGVRYLRREGQ